MESSDLLNAKAAFSKAKPVKLLKTTDSGDSKISVLTTSGLKKKGKSAGNNNHDAVCETTVKLVPREDGENDIHFTCSCGETTIIRCHSLTEQRDTSTQDS